MTMLTILAESMTLFVSNLKSISGASVFLSFTINRTNKIMATTKRMATCIKLSNKLTFSKELKQDQK